MTLTKSDIQSIKQALQPEFEKTKEDVRKALQPEFQNLERKLSAKIERLRRDNRKDHNFIMRYLDQQDTKLRKRIVRLEDHCGLPSPQ